MTDEEREDFMFNLRCLGQWEMQEVGDWIYFVHGKDLSPDGDGTIWKVRKDGSDLGKLQKSMVQVKGILGICNNWVYFKGKEGPNENGSLHMLMVKGHYYKMTLIGGLERPMSASDYDDWMDEIEEMEEEI